MSGLCSNRPEGFGPISQLADPLPTQCFFDTILVPTPTWLYMVALPILFFLTPKQRSLSSPLSKKWWSSVLSKSTWRSSWGRILVFVAYYFVVAVLVLMQTVEVLGLARIQLGVGLVPFAYVGFAGAVAMQATDGVFRRIRGYWAAAVALWVAGAAITALKITGVLGLGLEGSLARQDTTYATVHQFTDLIILGSFYILAVVAEIAVMVVRRKNRRSELDDDVVELRSEFDWK
ncbi:hypothetical protein E8E14_005168 [Neopestalotiopsis sp. 37M]|nr:hypothetical protein E8E14_005168 [Neopestalotiopsis sp. 37M]